MFCFKSLNFIVFEYLLNIHIKNFNFVQNLRYNLLLWKESLSFIFKIYFYFLLNIGFPSGSVIRIHPPMQETQEMRVWSLSWEDPLEKEMATHSSILAWRIPWILQEPEGCSPWGHRESDATEHAHTHTHTHTHRADLQCCVSFRCTTKWVSYIYTYMHSFFRFYSHIGHYRVLNRVPHTVYF